jgi:hypothetical protein
MRIHATRITGSLSVSGSGGVDFTNATAGVSGSFRPSDVKTALPTGTVSGSAQTSATLPENTVSSSAQIAVDISGSFTSVSSSLASRLTTEEGEAEGSVISSSAQIATDISGSFTSASSSLASRITTNKSNMTLATASVATNESNMTLATASVATNESNMTLATASIAAITASVSTLKSNVGQALNTDSAVTFATVDTGQGANELYDMDQNVLTTSSPTFAAATITGTLTATEVHTQYVSSSITVSSGSNTFGDEITDLHSFTGSLSVSGSGAITAHGNVSSSTSSTGSFGRVEGRTDFTTIDVDDDEIPIAKLASDNVSYGGISVTLGASDATPAFDLSDATAYTGDSSLVTTGTVTSGVWNSSFGATAATQITGSFAAVSSSLETKKASKGFTIAMSVAL